MKRKLLAKRAGSSCPIFVQPFGTTLADTEVDALHLRQFGITAAHKWGIE
jgi:hypothetical protein